MCPRCALRSSASTASMALRPPSDRSYIVYYGKLVRGGMGTGMPYWGSIFTDEELWALVDYVRSFAFSGEESSFTSSPEGPP